MNANYVIAFRTGYAESLSTGTAMLQNARGRFGSAEDALRHLASTVFRFTASSTDESTEQETLLELFEEDVRLLTTGTMDDVGMEFDEALESAGWKFAPCFPDPGFARASVSHEAEGVLASLLDGDPFSGLLDPEFDWEQWVGVHG